MRAPLTFQILLFVNLQYDCCTVVNILPPVRLKWKQYNAFYKKVERGIYQGSYPQSLGLFHCHTKNRLEIALIAFKCLKRYLPPKKMPEFRFRCGLHSFLIHVKSAIDNFSEEINLLYEIDPTLARKGKTMSIGKLLKNKKNKKKLRQKNHQLFTEISNTNKTKWFTDLKNLRNEEAVHGEISGKKWQATLGGDSPPVKLGMKNVSDFATWCPYILKETNEFLERCYQQM